MAQTFTAADILVEHVDHNGQTIEVPDFNYLLTDANREEGYAPREDAEEAWMEQHVAWTRWLCSADRKAVTIHVVGTSETATCPRGHRWIRTFGENDGYRQVS